MRIVARFIPILAAALTTVVASAATASAATAIEIWADRGLVTPHTVAGNIEPKD